MENIRKAVGAVIRHHNEYLLVHKVKIVDTLQGPMTVPGTWDFPKGGIQGAETEIEAIQRELPEETGSYLYRIIKRYDEKICFVFGEEANSLTRYDKQETTMFLMEYLGDRLDLHPQDEEIDQIGFFSAEKVLQWLSHDEFKRFYEQMVLAYEHRSQIQEE